MTDFFISDTHFGHERIRTLCNRPFASNEEMTEGMISRWNAKVGKHDRVWHLGDFGFGKDVDLPFLQSVFARLNGEKNLVLGNHDHSDVKSLPWNQVKDQHFYKGGGYEVHLFHYPVFDWNKRFHGSLHFYGHVHNQEACFNPQAKSYNLSVEMIDYEPKTVEEVLAHFS